MNKKLPFIGLIIFSTAFILFFYGKIVFHPDCYFFSASGDGMKNYFTYSYHIRYDSSYTNFSGMNYPYGEHFLYTDCHPVLANVLKLLATRIDFFDKYSIGILNFMMILSVYLTFYVCYYLLKEFTKEEWLTVLFSIGITLLSPQIFRTLGHYALSYSFAVPLSWWFMIKIFRKKEKMGLLFLFFSHNLFWFFIHAYLGMIITSFLFCLILVHFLLDPEKVRQKTIYLQTTLAILFPLLIFYLVAVLTDTHVGRTDNPSGFFEYNAEPDDLFLPSFEPLRPIFNALTHGMIRLNWEALAYMGFSSTLFIIIILLIALFSLVTRTKSKILSQSFQSRLLNSSLIAALIVLVLVAMAIPFKMFPSLIDLFPVLKQFRATGRFVWPFYFVMFVFIAAAMEQLYLNSSGEKRKLIVLVLCIGIGTVNILEAIPYHSFVSRNITASKNVFQRENLTEAYQKALQSFRPEDYQAILSLPFRYGGSESYSRPGAEETIKAYSIISLHAGLPLIPASLTRTSVQESKNIVQLVSPDFYKKEILTDLPNDKPFLVVMTKDTITAYEKDILAKCKPIYRSKELSLYALSRRDLFKNNGERIFARFDSLQSSMVKKDEFYLTMQSSFFYYKSFDSLNSDRSFRGLGGLQSTKKGTTTLAEFQPQTFEANKKYHVSIWMYNGMQDALNMWFRFTIDEYDPLMDRWESTVYFPERSEVINGNWSLVEGTFEVKDPANKIYILTKGKEDATQPFFADELLIKEYGVDVYKPGGNKKILFYNNHDVVRE